MSVSMVLSRAACSLRRDRGIVDQRMQLVVLQAPADFRDRTHGVVMVAKVDLDVILGPALPRADFRKACREQVMNAPAGRRRSGWRWHG